MQNKTPVPKPTHDDLLSEIRALRKQLKRPLTVRDITEARKRELCASKHRFVKTFGSLHLAIYEAGAGNEPLDRGEIEKRRQGGAKYIKSDEGQQAMRERMIMRLSELYKHLGKPPSATDIEKASTRGEMLPFKEYRRVFGNLEEAQKAAKIRVSAKKLKSRKVMIRELKELGKRLGRAPSLRDIKYAEKRGEASSASEYIKEFGSMQKARCAAGWAPLRPSHTEQDIAERLKKLFRQLKRPISRIDVIRASASGDFPSISVIKRRYGTFQNACKFFQIECAATKRGRRRGKFGWRFTNDEIIESLRALTRRLGRIPSYEDVDEASLLGEASSTSTLENRFGSFTKARKVARLSELVPDSPPDWSRVFVKYTKQDIVTNLRDLTRNLGRIPTTFDIDEAARLGSAPSVDRITRKFGMLENARRAAGLYDLVNTLAITPSRDTFRAKSRQYSESQAIDMLRSLTRRLRHVPTTTEIEKASLTRQCPSPRWLRNHFGSMVKAREVARLEEFAQLKHRIPKKYTKQELVKYLREMTRSLRRWPKEVEVEAAARAGLGPGANTLIYYFGSFRKACKAARLSEIAGKPWYKVDGYTKQEMLEKLRTLTRRLGHVPTFNEVAAASKQGLCPGTTTFASHFGSVPRARRAARLEEVLTNGDKPKSVARAVGGEKVN